MPDAMVTARMPLEKKEEVGKLLRKLGTNPSQVVNKLYDYVLSKRKLPFPEERKDHKYTKEEIQRAKEFVDSLSIPTTTGNFSSMSIKEAKRARLEAKELM